MKRNAARLLLLLFFVFSFYTQSFAKKLTIGLYNADAQTVTQFSSTQTVASWATDTTAKELVHVKVGVKSDAAAGDVTIYSFTLTIIFDPVYFEVTDASGTKITRLTGLSPYFPFDVVTPCLGIQNTIDYVTGTISYAAWWPASGFGCYNPGLTPLKATTTVPAMLAEFYLKPLKGSNGVEKTAKIDIDNDNTSVDDSLGVTYKKSDSNFLLAWEANHNLAIGYKFKIRPIPPTLAAPTATNTKVSLAWTSNDTTGAKYYVYRGNTFTSTEPTSWTVLTAGKDLPVSTTTFDDTTIKWDTATKKYWYKVTVKDSATTPVESCAASPTPAYSQCVSQGIVDTNVPVIASYDASSTVFDKAQISATLDEPGYIKANYSCPGCATPVNNQETAYGPFSAANKPSVTLPAFVAADEGQIVTFKVKAKDAAGNEMTGYTADKTFTITTCKETAAPSLSTPSSSISCPSSVVVSWDTGANASDSTIYYTKTPGFTDLKAEFAKGTAGVFKCNDPSLVKSPTNHSLTVPDCGGNPPLDVGFDYFYEVCSANCLSENCTSSANKFKLDIALNVTYSCSTTQAKTGLAYPLTSPQATFTGGCAPVTADIKYAADDSTLISSPLVEPMTFSGGTLSGSVPSTFIQDPLTSFKYYIQVGDSAGTTVVKPQGADLNAASACPVPVIPPDGLCGTPVAYCSQATGAVNQAASVSLEIKSGTPSYSCDLFFGTSQTSVMKKLSTKTSLPNGSYTETIPASELTSATTYYFQSKCTDSCAEGAKSAESTVCNIVVGGSQDKGSVKGIVKASDTNLPLAGATVKLIDPITSDTVTSNITTQSDGAFEFLQIPVKSGAPAYRVSATAAGYGTKLADVPSVTKDTATDVGDVVLDKTTKISGTCTDSKSGSAVANLKVTVKNVSLGVLLTKNTDSTGNYTVENLAPATYSVDVDVTGTKYKKPTTQNITVPPDGTANFLLEPSPVVSVIIAPASKSIGYNQQTAFWVDKVITSSGASLPKTPVEWDVSSLSSLGEVSYSDGSKTILIFKSGSKDGTATVSVTKIANEDVPANTVTTGTLNISQTLAVKEIKLLSPGVGTTAAGTFMPKPLTKADGYVIISSDVTHDNVSVIYRIYNFQGKLVKILNGDPVNRQANWDCTDDKGGQLPNGIYIIQAEAHEGGQSATPGKPKAITCMW